MTNTSAPITSYRPQKSTKISLMTAAFTAALGTNVHAASVFSVKGHVNLPSANAADPPISRQVAVTRQTMATKSTRVSRRTRAMNTATDYLLRSINLTGNTSDNVPLKRDRSRDIGDIASPNRSTIGWHPNGYMEFAVGTLYSIPDRLREMENETTAATSRVDRGVVGSVNIKF